MKVPEVHGVDKGLIPHVRPEHQKSLVSPTTHLTPPICCTRPTPLTQPVDQGLPTSIVPPIPKPRIEQGRAGIRRKPKVTLPIPKPIQTPAPPIPTPAPRAVQALPYLWSNHRKEHFHNIMCQQHHCPLFIQPQQASHGQ